MEHILTDSGARTVESPYYWVVSRSRTLPRNLEKLPDKDTNETFEYKTNGGYKTIERTGLNRLTDIMSKCPTDKMKRRSYQSFYNSGSKNQQAILQPHKTTSLRKASDNSQPDTQASCHSLHNTAAKSVSIHPEVTQYRYDDVIPR